MVVIVSFLLFLISTPEKESVIVGTATTIYDGNTLEIVTTSNESYRVVLAGIDCPELTQEYGFEAKAFLEHEALHKKVSLVVCGKDRLKNYLGIVMLSDRKDVRHMLPGAGLAWTSEKDPDPSLESIRQQAAEMKTGLWKEDKPTAPWIHRRELSMREAKSR